MIKWKLNRFAGGYRMESFTDRAVKIIKSIPPGKVMTYGQIAKFSGQPRGARQVVRILHSMSSKHQLPWHRVINAKGEIGLKNDEMYRVQKELLEEEGIEFTDRINLGVFLHHPEIDIY